MNIVTELLQQPTTYGHEEARWPNYVDHMTIERIWYCEDNRRDGADHGAFNHHRQSPRVLVEVYV